MRRALWPPRLKTVSFPTRSALGKVSRRCAKERKSPRFISRYQWASAFRTSGCFSANSFSRFRVMTCIQSPLPPARHFEGAGAERPHFAAGAIGVAGETAAAAMPDKPVGKEGPLFARDELHQVLLDFHRVGLF